MEGNGPRTFEDIVAPHPPSVRATAAWLRALILECFPQVDEGIHGGAKMGMALYSVGSPDAVALGLQPGPRVVKLYIHDPELLETSAFELEGRGKHMRHVKFDEPPIELRDELVELMSIPVERRS